MTTVLIVPVFQLPAQNKGVVVVTSDWIEDSLKKHSLQHTTDYQLEHNIVMHDYS